MFSPSHGFDCSSWLHVHSPRSTAGLLILDHRSCVRVRLPLPSSSWILTLPSSLIRVDPFRRVDCDRNCRIEKEEERPRFEPPTSWFDPHPRSKNWRLRLLGHRRPTKNQIYLDDWKTVSYLEYTFTKTQRIINAIVPSLLK